MPSIFVCEPVGEYDWYNGVERGAVTIPNREPRFPCTKSHPSLPTASQLSTTCVCLYVVSAVHSHLDQSWPFFPVICLPSGCAHSNILHSRSTLECYLLVTITFCLILMSFVQLIGPASRNPSEISLWGQ